jgi:hypothetical protein
MTTSESQKGKNGRSNKAEMSKTVVEMLRIHIFFLLVTHFFLEKETAI